MPTVVAGTREPLLPTVDAVANDDERGGRLLTTHLLELGHRHIAHIVGEAEVSEGRGTPTPFSLFAAPWLDAPRTAAKLNALGLPGVKFQKASFTPLSIWKSSHER